MCLCANESHCSFLTRHEIAALTRARGGARRATPAVCVSATFHSVRVVFLELVWSKAE